MKRILLLTGYSTQGEIPEAFFNLKGYFQELFNDDEFEFEVGEFKDVELTISSEAVDAYLNGTSIGNGYYGVIFYGGITKSLRLAFPIALVLKLMGVRLISNGAENYIGVDKVSQMIQFREIGLQVPKTYFGSPANILANAEKHIKYPMVVKDSLGYKGGKNYLVNNYKELEDLKDKIEVDRYIVQEFIPNDGDIRVLVDDEGNYFSYMRSSSDGGHLNNISTGGTASEYEVSPEIVESCVKILKHLGLQYGGVDFLFAEDGASSIFLEVNRQPQVFTGAYVHEKRHWTKEFIKRKIG